MNINNFSIDLKNNVLIVTNRDGATIDDVAEVKMIFEGSTGHTYNYVMWKDKLGYYHAYDYLKNYSIYCTSMNKTYAWGLVMKYIKENEIKNSSS